MWARVKEATKNGGAWGTWVRFMFFFVRQMRCDVDTGAGALFFFLLSFPWVDYFWCGLRISLVGCWVAATEPLGDGRQEMVFVVRRHSLT